MCIRQDGRSGLLRSRFGLLWYCSAVGVAMIREVVLIGSQRISLSLAHPMHYSAKTVWQDTNGAIVSNSGHYFSLFKGSTHRHGYLDKNMNIWQASGQSTEIREKDYLQSRYSRIDVVFRKMNISSWLYVPKPLWLPYTIQSWNFNNGWVERGYCYSSVSSETSSST